MKPASASELLRAAVRESGWTYYGLAKACGLSRPSLTHFVEGRTSIRLDLADRLITFLGLTLVRTGPLPAQPITPRSRAAAFKRARLKKSGKASTSAGRATSSSKSSTHKREG